MWIEIPPPGVVPLELTELCETTKSVDIIGTTVSSASATATTASPRLAITPSSVLLIICIIQLMPVRRLDLCQTASNRVSAGDAAHPMARDLRPVRPTSPPNQVIWADCRAPGNQ